MTTPISPYDQMLVELDALESRAALREDTNFVVRTDAIDRIEVHLLDRLNAVAAPSDDWVRLKLRAEFLFDQLAVIDKDIFQQLRAGIVDGSLRGDSLRKEFDRYVGKPNMSDRGYGPLDVFVSGLLRLDTRPHEARAREPEMVFYQPTPVRVILELIEIIPITPGDVFYDLGSGLGQVCILIHLLTGARTRGIEFDPGYCDYARQSAQRLNLPRVDFVNADARAVNYADGTIFFMYTPFKGAMMESVLQEIEHASRGRTLYVCAYGECAVQVSNQRWLSLIAQRRNEVDALAVFARNDLTREP